MSYEAMRRQPAETLAKVIELLGEPYGQEGIDEAVRFGSFENLRKLEAAGHFSCGGLAKQASHDPSPDISPM